MKKYMTIGSIGSFLLGIISVMLYKMLLKDVFFSLAVTFFTTFYHFIMRVAVGCAVVRLRKNKDISEQFTISRTESRFYEFIKVKKWKKYMPTYNRQLFSIWDNSYRTVMHNMENALAGHFIMVILSFVPLAFANIVGGFVPFLITSVLAAVFDILLVFVQRYNMARMGCILKRIK